MKRYSIYALGLILVALFAVSCASTPPAPEPPAPPPDKAAAPVVPAVPSPDAELKNAEELKATIEKYGLSFAKPDEFKKANEELAAGKNLMGKDNAGAKKLLDSASARYQVVMDSGISEGAKARMAEMGTAKNQAAAMRADIAAADKYGLGLKKQTETNQLYGQKKYQEAWDASGEAIVAFNESYEIAKEKRAAAEKAMNTSAKDETATGAKLEEVSKEIGGGAQ